MEDGKHLAVEDVGQPYVREQLEQEFGRPFAQEFLSLPGGGRHEFDAVSRDRTIVTSIKSSSELSSGGRRPGGKILACYAELYYLLQTDAPIRLLILTNPEFYNIFVRDSRGRLAPGLELKLVALPPEMQQQKCTSRTRRAERWPDRHLQSKVLRISRCRETLSPIDDV